MEKLKRIIDLIEPLDKNTLKKAQARLDILTKPQGSLGRLEELAKTIIAIKGKEIKELPQKAIFTFAADHGVAEEGVSAFPQEVTLQMVRNFINGGAAVNVLAAHAGARLVLCDIGVSKSLKADKGLVVKKWLNGTQNMSKGPAMSRQDAIRAIETGIESLEEECRKGLDLAGTGEMGIANTTAASAITAVLTRKDASQVTGKGTGIMDAILAKKIKIIRRSIKINKPDPRDPLDVLSKVGGLEIAALTGVILAAASRKVPVIIDGFISASAALSAFCLCPVSREYMIASHCSAEKGHRYILKHMKHLPVLDLGLRLGEGTGACLAMPIIDAALKIYHNMATFTSAGVSREKAK